MLNIDVPKYDELSVKGLYDKLLSLDNMKKYFPDTYPKGRGCDRDYMFNVANTLHPGVVQELIDHAVRQRHDPTIDQNKQESIMISQKWVEELNSLPMVPKVRNTFSLRCLLIRHTSGLCIRSTQVVGLQEDLTLSCWQ